MAKSASGKSGSDQSRSPSANAGGGRQYNARFVGIELLGEEKQQFRALLESGEFEGLSPDDFLERGYKVTFTSDKRGGGVICTVSAPDPTHLNNGLLLTGRGRDSTTALAVATFKDIYLCPDGLWLEAEARRRGAVDDIG